MSYKKITTPGKNRNTGGFILEASYKESKSGPTLMGKAVLVGVTTYSIFIGVLLAILIANMIASPPVPDSMFSEEMGSEPMTIEEADVVGDPESRREKRGQSIIEPARDKHTPEMNHSAGSIQSCGQASKYESNCWYGLDRI